LKCIKKASDGDLLTFFHTQNIDHRHEYRIWQDIAHKPILTDKVLLEEMEYLHNNPIRKKWHLVDDRDDYKYSSAGYYDLGKQGCIAIDAIEELWK
jgi:hypothetical protein